MRMSRGKQDHDLTMLHGQWEEARRTAQACKAPTSLGHGAFLGLLDVIANGSPSWADFERMRVEQAPQVNKTGTIDDLATIGAL